MSDIKSYTFEVFSAGILSVAKVNNFGVIGITGASCVGKSTLAECLLEHAGDNFKACVIHVDNYLKGTYRGQRQYRKNNDNVLNPSHYDWKRLYDHILRLQETKDVRLSTYTRGEGWGSLRMIEASDLLIVEGLFLDSVKAASFFSPDLMIVLKADRDLIYRNRRKRDSHYNSLYSVFRSERETRTEAFRTIYANEFYERADISCSYLEMHITDSYEMELLTSKKFAFMDADLSMRRRC